jgi:hypothetical protein
MKKKKHGQTKGGTWYSIEKKVDQYLKKTKGKK